MKTSHFDKWEKENRIEAQEWEHLAMEKCDLNNEEFLSHYFEPHMCLVCFRIAMFSILRTRKTVSNGTQDYITSKWCTGCGHYHGRERYNTGVNRYGRVLKKRHY